MCPDKSECIETAQLLAEKAAENAAEKAVKKVFELMGVDVNNPRAVEDFREDLRFGRRMRRAADRSFIVMVSVIAAAIIASIWLGIVSNISTVVKGT